MPLPDSVDTSPLTALPARSEVRDYRQGRAAFRGPRVQVRPCLGGVSYTVLLVTSGAVTAAMAASHADARAVVLGGAVAVGSAVGAALCARATRARVCLREYRLAAFAARNGLLYERGAASPCVPGLQFSADGRGSSLRRFTGSRGGVPIEAGNYRHATGDISGYVIRGEAAVIVPPFDFADPTEWHRAWRLLGAD